MVQFGQGDSEVRGQEGFADSALSGRHGNDYWVSSRWGRAPGNRRFADHSITF
jgi:hypothetical protein